MPRRGDHAIEWSDVTAFLEKRRGLLDAVVFSGGEPTVQPGLPAAIRDVRALGFRVGLHTAGIHPQRLAQVLPLVHWIGMDVKTQFHRYREVTGVPGSGERARRSVELILASGVEHEFRTTVHPRLLPFSTLSELADDLARRGVRRYVIQEFRPTGCMSQALLERFAAGYGGAELERLLAPRFEHFAVRAA